MKTTVKYSNLATMRDVTQKMRVIQRCHMLLFIEDTEDHPKYAFNTHTPKRRRRRRRGDACSIMSDSFYGLITAAHQVPLSMEFSRQEYWCGLPFPSPEDLPNPGMEPTTPVSLHWQVNSLPPHHLGSPLCTPLNDLQITENRLLLTSVSLSASQYEENQILREL